MIAHLLLDALKKSLVGVTEDQGTVSHGYRYVAGDRSAA